MPPLASLLLPLAAAAAAPFMTEMVALLAAAAAIAYLSFRVGIVPIAGFLLAGVLIGPNALGVVDDLEMVEALAEIGVVLLLFTIGIEFRLDQLARIGRAIFGGGGLQVGLTTAAVTLATMAFGVDWRNALFTGCLVALSSTALVLKLLGDRRATATPLGQQTLGILIFQDLAVVAMVLLVPMLGGEGTSTGALLGALASAAGIVALVLVAARRVVPPLLEAVARTCAPEIFLLTVVALCFGTAWLTSLAGVSLALGAFLAGLLVSESRFSHHALGEIMPLQILFSATFFVSIGMLLDVRFVLANLPLVAAAVLVVVAVKFLGTAIGVRLMGLSAATAGAAGLLLAQVGEFSFVLERSGAEAGLSPAGLGERGGATFVAATVVLMLATPFLADGGFALERRLARRAAESGEAREDNDDTRAPDSTPRPNNGDRDGADDEGWADHVIVDGWGPAGQGVARALGPLAVPFVVVTLNPDGALAAEAETMPVVRGSTSRLPTLREAGLGAARVLLVGDDDPETTRAVVAVARGGNAAIQIVARTEDEDDVDELKRAGADAVVVAPAGAVGPLLAAVLDGAGWTRQEIAGALDTNSTDGTAAGSARVRERGRHVALSTDRAAAATATTTTTVKPAAGTTSAPGLCSHLDQMREVTPRTPEGCEECLRTGDEWVHLRLCLSCGHVGCCDSSKNRHAQGHARERGHAIVQSFEKGEDWRWCYPDEIYV